MKTLARLLVSGAPSLRRLPVSGAPSLRRLPVSGAPSLRRLPVLIATALPVALLALFLAALPLASPAAVPLRWAVETSRLQPVTFDAVRGETIALEAAFNSYGKPLQLDTNAVYSLYYQTNGMASAWWQAPAALSLTNRLTATVTPAMVPQSWGAGASSPATIIGFLGSTGQIYRAMFTLRFRHGPGATPNAIDAPVPILDLANTTVVNPPWPTTNDFTTATNSMQAALKNYVDSEIQGAGVVSPTTVTNIVDAKIAVATNGIVVTETDPTVDAKITTATNGLAATYRAKGDNVCHETSETQFTDWVANLPVIEGVTWADQPQYYEDNRLLVWWSDNDDCNAVFNGPVYGDETELTFSQYEGSISFSPFTATRSAIRYATSNETFVTSTYVTNAAASAASATVASDAYPKASGEALATQVASVGAHLNAEDARFVSTNYNSTTRLPEAYVEIQQSNEWVRVWSEMTRWNAFTGGNFDWSTWCGVTGLVAQVAARSPKEYAFYDGVTGDIAPDGYFWIAQPHVAVCAGASYQRYVDGASEVWVLESNGMVADINGTTNGYFRITDSEGDTQFEIIKGDKRTVFANCYAMTQTNVNGVTHYYTTYAVTNALAAPTAKVTTSLTNATWYADSDASCPCNVSWTAGNNSYTLEWWPKTTMPSMFVKAEYDTGGETRIRNTAPVEMPTIIIGNVKYTVGTTTVNGETVMKLTPAN